MLEKFSSVVNLGCPDGISKKQDLDKPLSSLGTDSGSRCCRYNHKFRTHRGYTRLPSPALLFGILINFFGTRFIP